MDVGFIGLGTMGAHMARNLQKKGHKLFVHDVRRAAADSYVADGAAWMENPKAVAEGVEVVFTSLPGPPEVEAVALGPDGLLSGMRTGSVWFDLSTNSPQIVRKLNTLSAGRGVHMLDAPVSGGPAAAAAGKLALWVSGDSASYAKYEALLADIGNQARYIGESGQGSVAKLVHNCAGYIINIGLAEVFSLGVKAGMEPLALWEAVREGALGRNRTFDVLAPNFLPGHFDPPSFALKLAHKDVSLATQLGRELGVPMRLANMTLEEMTEAMGRGWGDRDSRSAMLLETERAGVTVKVDPEAIKAVLNPKN